MTKPILSTEAPAGLLAIDKPGGPSSHDVVAAIRRALRTRRVGHTGTLDPFASGLLILCVGVATRFAEFLVGLDKSYDAELRLGTATDTDDATGAVIARSDAWQGVTEPMLRTALAAQTGVIDQVPPAYSAKKIEGQRSYRLARAGTAATLRPVRVRVARIELLAYTPPDARLRIDCSSGTYIRAIARDVGAALDCHGHLAALRRTRVGGFGVDHALPLGRLDPDTARAALLPTHAAVAHLPRMDVTAADAARLRFGQRIAVPDSASVDAVAVFSDGTLLGIGRVAGGVLAPRKVLPDA